MGDPVIQSQDFPFPNGLRLFAGGELDVAIQDLYRDRPWRLVGGERGACAQGTEDQTQIVGLQEDDGPILSGLVLPSEGFELSSDVEHFHWRRLRQGRLSIFHWKGLHALTKTGSRTITRVRLPDFSRYCLTMTPQAIRGPPGASLVGGSGRYISCSSWMTKALPSWSKSEFSSPLTKVTRLVTV